MRFELSLASRRGGECALLVRVFNDRYSLDDGEFNQSRHIMDLELVHHSLTMRFHSADAYAQFHGNLAVRLAFGNFAEDLGLPLAQIRGSRAAATLQMPGMFLHRDA